MRKMIRGSSKNALLIRRYGISVEASRKNISDIFDELFGLAKELSAIARLRGGKGRELARSRAPEIFAEVASARAKLEWELGLVVANSGSAAAIIESESPRRAMSERVSTGAYRARVLERLSEFDSLYRKILKNGPSAWEV